MSDEIDIKVYSASALRNWARELGLATSGTKAQLAMRINSVPTQERGSCPDIQSLVQLENIPEEIADDAGGKSNESEASANNFRQMQRADIEAPKKKPSDKNNKKISNNNDATTGGENESERDGNNDSSEEEVDGENVDRVATLSQMVAQLQKENEKLKQQQKSDCSIDNKFFMNAISEATVEYDGNEPPDNWIKELKNVSSVFGMDENLMRVLLLCKLKGKAHLWVHASPERLTLSVDKLLQQLQVEFSPKESKTKLREKFELRKWHANESFADYVSAKISLTKGFQIDEEEILECIIDGIPDPQLRLQVNIHGWTSKEQLLGAFSNVRLKPDDVRSTARSIVRTSTRHSVPTRAAGHTPTRQAARSPMRQAVRSPASQSGRQRVHSPAHTMVRNPDDRGKNLGATGRDIVRCYNCNSIGHMAAQCQKSKREYGACYGCGSIEHQVKDCPERKEMTRKHNRSNQGNEYNA